MTTRKTADDKRDGHEKFSEAETELLCRFIRQGELTAAEHVKLRKALAKMERNLDRIGAGSSIIPKIEPRPTKRRQRSGTSTIKKP